jgi:ATP-dependent helicase HrpA
LCRKELISYQRGREWQDVHAQLAEVCRQLGFVMAKGAPGPLQQARRAQVHQALLAGLVTQVGAREGDRTDFVAPRGARFAIWPGSVLAKKPPQWVMAAELVETGRLWARVAAPVRPQWVEAAASHLLKWTYSEPAWDPGRGESFVVARATLYGLAVVAGRRVGLARLDPEAARDMFIRGALVEGDWDEAPDFVAQNLEVLQRLRALYHRARRTDLMVGDDALLDFYASRVPEQVTSGRAFSSWWRGLSPADRGLLDATPDDLKGSARVDLDAAEFPDTWPSSGQEALALQYNWEPGQEDDGVVVQVPLAQLGRLADEGLEWQVPGLREELVTALVRSLPKDLRRHLVPVPDNAREFVAKWGPADGPLLPALARAMTDAAGERILSRDFDWAKVPGHLRPTFAVVDEAGQTLARGKEIDGLLADLRPQLDRALQVAASSSSLTWGPPGRRASSWEFGTLPRVFEPEWHGYRLRGFPALVDEGDAVSVGVFSDEAAGRLAMAAGTRRLLALGLPSRRHLVDQLEHMLDNRAKLALGALRDLAYRSPRDLADDVVAAAIDQALAANGGPAWDAAGFEALSSAVRRDVEPAARKALASAARIISRLQELAGRTDQLRARAAPGPQPSLDDITAELAALAGPRVVSRAGLARLPDIERYLTALERRLEKLPTDPRRDLAFTERAQAIDRQVDQAITIALQEGMGAGVAQELEDLRWLIEELRVSFFAQSLGTRVPVSEERILKAATRLLTAPGP